MSNRLATLIFTLSVAGMLVGGCRQASSADEKPLPPPSPAATNPSPPPVATGPIEFIDSEEVTLNGTQHLVGNATGLYNVLGRPDSLVTPNLQDYCMPYYDNRPFQCAYYGRSCVEVYGDTAVVTTVNFSRHPGVVLQSAGLRLSRTTSLQSLANVFPQAVKNQAVVTMYQVGKRVAVVLESAQVPNDYRWVLYFHNGLLESIDLGTPC